MTTIVARPHPLRNDFYSAEIEDGATLFDTFGDLPECVKAQVDGVVWERDRWGEALPGDGVVTLYSTPENNNVGRAIAMIAIAVLSVYTGGAAGGAASAAGWSANAVNAAYAAAAAATTIAGSLAVNALIPPKMPSAPENHSPNVRQSITGTRNAADPYGVVPRVYGNPRWYPKLAANPMTEIAGNDQYLRMMVVLGYGPLEVAGHRVGKGYPLLTNVSVGDALRVAETSLDEYEDVEWEIGTADQMTLDYPDISEEAIGVALDPNPDHRDDVWVNDGVSATRTTAPGTKEISVDLVFPQGLFSINDNGTLSATSVRFSISYRPAGDTEASWVNVTGGTWQIDGPTKDTKRINKRWTVPVGQYDVMVERVSSYHGGTESVVTDCQWSVLRSVQSGPAYTGDHVLMGLRIRATDQLNGVIDQLNVKTQAVLRTYNGTTFEMKATNNPAWAYLDALTGEQVGRPVPDQQIDFASIHQWAAFCGSQGLSYHWVHDANETVLERARTIAATGQASFALQDGRFGVVRDGPSEPTVQAITPRNAMGFSSSRQFKDLPHALRVKYIDPDTWADAERIVYRDGYNASNATRFEDFETQGVASAEEAYHHGQYHIRQAILRPETHTVQMDWENLAVMRGNRVRLAYDAIKVGLGWGRIKAINGLDITLDERVRYETSRAYGIRVRGATGPQSTTVVTSGVVGDTNTLTMAEPIDVEVGDLVLYGVLDKESVDCKVSRIQHAGDFTASLTLVPAAPDIYNYSDAPIWDPGITNPIPIDRIKPPTPVITSARGGEDAAHQNPDGSFQTLIRVSYALHAQPGMPSLQVEARYRVVGSDQWQKSGTFSVSGTLTIRDVLDGENYEIQIRAINGIMFSSWSATVTLEASGHAVLMPKSVDLEIGTFSIAMWPRGLYPNSQWEFYKSQAPLSLSDVEQVGTRLGIGSSYADTDLTPDTTYYYYIRGWSAQFVSAWYSVEVTTDNNPNAILKAITGEIDDGVLAQSLKEKVDKIPVIEGEVTRVEEKINIELGETSLVRDGSFDHGIAEWEVLTGSDLLTIVRRDDDSRTVTVTSPSEYMARMEDGLVALTQAPRASVTAGDMFTVSVDCAAYSGSSVPFLFGVEWSDENGNVIENTVLVDETITSNVWETFGPATVIVPDGAVKARISVIRQPGNGVLNVTNVRAWRADKVLAERINTVQATANQNAATIQEVDKARIDGDEALAERITTTQASVGDLSSTVQQVDKARADGDKALASRINSVQSSVDEELAAVEQTMETTAKLVTDSEGGSLILNGSLTTGDATGWRSVRNDISFRSPPPERPSGSGRRASSCCFVVPSGYTSHTVIATSSEFSVREGEKVTATFDFATFGGQTVSYRVYFRFGMPDGTYVANVFSPWARANHMWQRLNTHVATVPEAATTAYVGIQVQANNTAESWVTNLAVHRADVILSSQYLLKLQANGLVGGFGVYNDGATVEAGFDVDRFWIGRTNNDKVKPFVIDGGRVIMREALIGDATITNAKIKNAAITSGKLANASINNAKIQNGAISRAKIQSAAIGRAQIGDLAVDTIRIADQAVTIPASSFTVGGVSINESWTTVQSVSINPQGNPVDLTISCLSVGNISTSSATASVSVEARLLRNGSVMIDYGDVYRDRSYSQYTDQSAPSMYFAETAAFGYRTGVLSGNQTFVLQFRKNIIGGGGGVSISKRFMKTAGVRK